MGNFVSQTKPQMVDGSCSGPCISYYIAAIVEALLHFCTTRQERLSEDYGDWVYELIKLYRRWYKRTTGGTGKKEYKQNDFYRVLAVTYLVCQIL